MLTRKISTTGKVFCIAIISIAGCILLVVVAMPILGFSPRQINYNEWANRFHQFSTKNIAFDQIMDKYDDNQGNTLNHHHQQEKPARAPLCTVCLKKIPARHQVVY